jgi:serine/threonine-protein phosphatase with EF-hand domain
MLVRIGSVDVKLDGVFPEKMTRTAQQGFEMDDVQAVSSPKVSRPSITLDSVTLQESPVKPMLVRIGSVDVKLDGVFPENLADYNLTKEAFSINMVQEVLQLYAAGGKLSIRSLRRILREAYKMLKAMPNVVHVPLDSTDEVVTVVGDLHGQFGDLMHLLSTNGLPSEKHKYIFNGDFVDRGPKGVEILVVLFMLMTALPNSVFLNRGNHEDFGLCCVYGFQKECLTKYDDVVFSMFCEMFRHLPVCSVIHNKVLVIHGGLFYREGVSLDDLGEIDRLEYVVPSQAVQEVLDSEGNPLSEKALDLQKLMHGALWSDPDLDNSLPNPQPNPRGAGILFGPDLTLSFLEHNNLVMVVRSHECVEDGFDLPFEDFMEGTCATIFSASNYGGSMNRGAVLNFSLNDNDDSFLAGGEYQESKCDSVQVFYNVRDYHLSLAQNRGTASLDGVTNANRHGLSTLVLRKKKVLAQAFAQVDRTNSGLITVAKWAGVLEHVTGLHLQWPALLDTIVSPEDREGELINWSKFLNKFHVQLKSGMDQPTVGASMFDALYSDRERLEAIFRFFDTDNNGSISRDEFRQGCEILNKNLRPGEQLEDPDGMLDIMDIDHSDSVDVNEFFEVFRLMDIRAN